MEREKILELVLKNSTENSEKDVFSCDSESIAFVLDNCEITVPEENRFFVEINACGILEKLYYTRVRALKDDVETEEVRNGALTRAYTGRFDFSHTTPFWEDVLTLGIYGLRERIVSYLNNDELSEEQRRFFDGCLKVYDAAIRFLKRAGSSAEESGKIEMARGLAYLSENSPETLYHKMQTVFAFYMLQHNVEATYLRTLGRLDSLLYSSFIKEDEAVGIRLVKDFIKEIDTLKAPANIPFAICGTDEYGKDLTNPLSFIILDAYGELNTTNTKFHILCSKKTPDSLLRHAFEYIRAGKNSIVFMSDEAAIEGLKKLGAEHNDACNYHVVGCYECGAEGELTCTCNARVNVPKALEVTLNGGKDVFTGISLVERDYKDFSSFEELFSAFLENLLEFTSRAVDVTNEWESRYPLLHCSPFLSSTYPSSLEAGRDLYVGYSAKYNNSSINALGLATAVDSLAAIRRLVYVERKYSLREFSEILKNNWDNNEVLRLRIKNNYPKYGVGDRETDELASRIIERLYEYLNGKSNAKGGVWRLGTLSINWRWEFGEYTHATADGRFAGETISQNTSATFGADKQGATAHLLSVTAFDHTLTPNGSIADIDLHVSAVRGENGIRALLSTLKTYFGRKGLAVHYNVLNTDTLRRAKEDPSAYPNLQVRLCGWNVLFNSLSEKEKDDFIFRAEGQENL